MTTTERLSARVVGRVQGVGYRWWAVDTASRLGLAGWVRNADDDRSVELVAEGPSAALDALVAQLRDGPGAAYVERVDVTRGPATGELTGFVIRR